MTSTIYYYYTIWVCNTYMKTRNIIIKYYNITTLQHYNILFSDLRMLTASMLVILVSWSMQFAQTPNKIIIFPNGPEALWKLVHKAIYPAKLHLNQIWRCHRDTVVAKAEKASCLKATKPDSNQKAETSAASDTITSGGSQSETTESLAKIRPTSGKNVWTSVSRRGLKKRRPQAKPSP